MMRWMPTVSALVLLAACAPPQGGEPVRGSQDNTQRLSAGPLTVDVTVPEGTDVIDVAVGATRRLQIQDRASVLGVATSTGSRETRVGNDADVLEVVSRPNVHVWHRASVGGDVSTAGRARIESSAVIDGTVTTHQPFGDDVVVPIEFDVPDVSNGTVHLEPSQHATAAPGRYDALIVKSRASLTLTAGTYYTDQLQLEPNGSLNLDETDGPIIIVVDQSVIARGNWVDVDGGDPLDLVLAYTGRQQVVFETPFDGFVVAPEGTVVLGGNDIAHDGAFFARDLEVRPGVEVHHRPFDIGRILRPFFPRRDLVALNVGTLVDDGSYAGCEPGFAVVMGEDEDGNEVPITTELVDNPGIPAGQPGCVAPVTFCDDNEVPLDPQPELPDGTAAVTSSCDSVDPNATDLDFDPTLRCEIDPSTLGGSCTTDAECGADAFCVPCGLLDDCSDGERRCGSFNDACTDAYDGEESCVEIRECAYPGATGTLSVTEFNQKNPSTTPVNEPPPVIPTPPPAVPTYMATCPELPVGDASRNEGSNSPREGSSQWRIAFDSDFDKYVEVEDAAAGIQKFRVGAKARFAAAATVLGWDIEIFDVGAFANADSCNARAEAVLKVGGQFTSIPDTTVGANLQVLDPTVCNAALPTDDPDLPDLLSELPADGGLDIVLDSAGEFFDSYVTLLDTLRDAQTAVEVLPSYGYDSRVCEAALVDQGVSGCEIGNCPPCDGMLPALDDFTYWTDKYDDQALAFLDEQTALLDTLGSQVGTLQVPVGGFGDSFLLRAPPIDIPIGPFKIGIEIGVGGGYELALDARLDLNPLAPTPAEAGAVLTPSAFALAEAYVNFGVSIGIADASIGITTNLRLLDVALPVEAFATLSRVTSVDPRPGPYAANRLFGDKDQWDLGFRWGVFMEGSLLSGDVNLTVKVRFLFFSKRWNRRLAEWNGIQLPRRELIGGMPISETVAEFPVRFDVPGIGVLQVDPATIVTTEPTPEPGDLNIDLFPTNLGEPCVPPPPPVK